MRIRMTLWWLALALGAGATAHAGSGGQQLAESAGRSLIGSPAPALILRTIDGQSIELSHLYGHQAVYLKFWATWCVPCRQQMPHFEQTFEHAGHELAVIAVNAGFNDSVEDVKAYRQSVGLHMPIVIDDGRLADALHLRVTPQHVVIGRDGNIAYIGHLVDERLETALRAAQAEPGRQVTVRNGDNAAGQRSAALGVGSAVPAGEIKATDGSTLSLQDPAKARPTVIMFMSPWCESYLEKSRPQRAAACRRAREQSEQMAAAANYRWLGIASGLWATQEDLTRYREEKHVAIPLALDESGKLFREFGVREVPAFVMVSASGTIVDADMKLTHTATTPQ
jgi:peroxiredoxin